MKVKSVTTYLNENNMPYLVAEETPYVVDGRKKHDNSEAIYELTKQTRMVDRATEMVMLFIFDSAFHLIAMNPVSTGSIDRSIVDVRSIAQTVLLAGGKSCIMAHNHPSGDTTPSDMDIAITTRLQKGLELVGISLVEHLVVGKYGYTSLKEMGII